eukprot:CAMPEP_0201631356 /NCGR_PEP_ID=MMETSP0493-20130528/5367_1 /ASSEMBLY_ACC=CAM_ASM_000838 /TAXON_ID=420259 /ORGANISM="Thalassiosira gravida, Strain GMp14c1" /LENGTH=260 /DNA_ID=CAMNT_0048102681 /DNA_START=278 /DNA_END=1060 /DNA_ORIENTATION=+
MSAHQRRNDYAQPKPYAYNDDGTFANSNANFYATTNTIHHAQFNDNNNDDDDDDNENYFKFESVRRAIQYWLDKSTIHIVPRWILFAVLLLLFFLRIYLIQGYFIVAYGLGIYLLNNFIAFLSPLEDPTDVGGSRDDGLSLPSTSKEGKEYRPFARRLPEFKFWMACARGVGTSVLMTFFSVFDVPVFWPILLMYFGVLFFMTMKRQIAHMWKHKYVPISFGKSKYKDAGKEKGEFGGGMSGSLAQPAGYGAGGGVSRRR